MTFLFPVLPQFLGLSERASARFSVPMSHDIRQPFGLDSISSRARLDDCKMAHCLVTCNGATAAVDMTEYNCRQMGAINRRTFVYITA